MPATRHENTMNGDVVIPQVESPVDRDAAATATGAAAAYDFVFITHLPSFYKVNLYEQLSRRGSVFVIFLGASSTIRTADFVKEPAAFDHFFLSQGSVEPSGRDCCSSTAGSCRSSGWGYYSLAAPAAS
jgi:hypothetical protein